MPYTQEDFQRDYAEMCRLALPAKPDDPFKMVQWEMARSHKAFIEYWIQIEKQFDSSAPINDTENYLQFALEWIRVIEIHHTLEEEVQFTIWSAVISNSVTRDREEHVAFFATLEPFKAYLSAVLTDPSANPWDPIIARTLSIAFVPLLMNHFVGELYPLEASNLLSSGLELDTIANTFKDVAVRGKEIMDVFREVPAMMEFNGGAKDWPPLPSDVMERYEEIYKVHEGWWKYSKL
ncbi:hypothetical protein D9757_001009 [Collybiopsis confluens]|uniref:Hemerythrin-like domain-containing protein n=1 Tax=Collybiopsis confluens TaxID=2823264 RepID=A0A8H5I069_9AGAR|nr:hypothetical protein D9757_001009 [Collybiopsis confluens]